MGSPGPITVATVVEEARGAPKGRSLSSLRGIPLEPQNLLISPLEGGGVTENVPSAL
jgi:hypothetical protein